MIFRLPAYVDLRGEGEKSAYNWLHTKRARARRWLAPRNAGLSAGEAAALANQQHTSDPAAGVGE